MCYGLGQRDGDKAALQGISVLREENAVQKNRQHFAVCFFVYCLDFKLFLC